MIDAPPGGKRGLVARQCAATRMFSQRARTWQYNHGASLTQFGHAEWRADGACRTLAAGGLFVPMVASLHDLERAGREIDVASRATRWLLAMNEPSIHNNQSARAVAARWPEVEALAARFSPPLLLASPAPGGLELEKGDRWLRDFFVHCRGCRVDAVAVHFYECDGRTDATASAAAAAMMRWLDALRRRHGRPLWLTEFNCGDGAAPQPLANQSAAAHLRFMRAALPLLEAAGHVHRYSWFQAWQRHTPWRPGRNPGCSLLAHDGSALSELGRFYSEYDAPYDASAGPSAAEGRGHRRAPSTLAHNHSRHQGPSHRQHNHSHHRANH